jgi:glycosyltransferase involved in cell wall biosynthesis
VKILLIAPMLPHAEGAGAIPVLLHAELVGLRAHHDVTLVAGIGDEPGEDEAAAALIQAGVDVHLAERRRPGSLPRRFARRARLARSWARGRRPWRTVWFAAPSIQMALDRLSAVRSFDVVAVEDNSMSVFRLPPGVPAVLTEHEVQRPPELARPSGGPSDWPRWLLHELDRRRWTRFQPAAWRRFDLVQVFSDYEARAIRNLAPDLAPRVRVNPFGLMPPAPADPSREQPGTVLFVGNFTHPPNREAALWLARDIMPAVRASYPTASLRVVGTSPPREVAELAGPYVEVVGNVPSVRPHLDVACVVIAPVRTGGGMRMKVLHALASGKAVVTTPLGASGFTLSAQAPPFIIADDTESIAFETARLLQDHTMRRELGARGRAFALEHHTPAAWASRLERIYQEASACVQDWGKARCHV